MITGFLILLLAFITLFFPGSASAQTAYTINHFDSKLNVLPSGEVQVAETINVNFLESKHGIYRDIPYIYLDPSGNKTYTNIDVEQVLQDGQNAKFSKYTDGNNIRLKIGDADKTIIGEHIYKIDYKVAGVITSQNGFDELYWNTTGNGWDAPIASATAIIKLPKPSLISADCYEGAYSSNESCEAKTENLTSSSYWSTRNLTPGEGMTVVVGFTKGIVPILTVERPKTFFEKLFSLPSAVIFLATLIGGILSLARLWIKYGRDFWHPGISGMMGKTGIGQIKPIGATEPVVVEFTPPENLNPAIVGILTDERADTLDVTATIIDLASRGFLTITEIPKKWLFGSVDYELSETKKDRSKLLGYEKELLDRLFTQHQIFGAGFTKPKIKTSELKTTFYDDLAKVKDQLYEEVLKRKYFPTNPNRERNKYLIIGFVVLFAGLFAVFLSASSGMIYLTSFSTALIPLGVLTIILSRFMSRRTAQGRELYRRIRGYRLFIERAESYKQKFFENKNIFTDILPYTIVFGLTEKFANQLKDMGLKPNSPSWYHSTTPFNIASFANNVNNFSSSMSTAITSTPSSSGSGGGGFSGGGFGGGGGGSW